MGPCSGHAPTPLKGTGLLSLSLFVLLPGLAQPCHAHCAVLAAGRVAFRASCGLPGHNSSFCRHSRRVYCLVLRPSVLLTSRLEAETRLFCTVLAAEPVPQQCCPALPWDPRRRQCMARPEPRHRAAPRPPPPEAPWFLQAGSAMEHWWASLCSHASPPPPSAIYFFTVLTQVWGYLRVLFLLCHLKFRQDFLQNPPF